MKKYFVGALVLLSSVALNTYAAGDDNDVSTSGSAINELEMFVDTANKGMDKVMEMKKETMAKKMNLIEEHRKQMMAIKKNMLKKWKKNPAKYEGDAQELLMQLKEAKKENLNKWQEFLTSNHEEWSTFIKNQQKDMGFEEEEMGTPAAFAVIEEEIYKTPTATHTQGVSTITASEGGMKETIRMPARQVMQSSGHGMPSGHMGRTADEMDEE